MQTGYGVGQKMKDIIKAQLYQLKKERIIYVIFVVTLFLQCTMMIGELDLMNASDASAGFYAAGAGSNMIIMSLMFAMMLTGIICSTDFMDKTANYELMCGHLRRNMYFGRVVPGLIIGTAGTMIISAAPIILCSILYGWGNTVSPGDLITRWVLSIFPIFRVICEFVFISYIVKNAYIVMVVSFIVSMVGASYLQLIENGSLHFLGLGSLYCLFDCKPWTTYTLVGEKSITVYDTTIYARDVMEVTAFSMIFGILFLWLGYWFFAHDDLN